jgi:hypothetical protein
MKEPIYFEINPDVLDVVVAMFVTGIAEQMEKDLLKRKKGLDVTGVFDADRDKDIDKMEEHLAAFRLLLEYITPMEQKNVYKAKSNRARTGKKPGNEKVGSRKRARSH